MGARYTPRLPGAPTPNLCDVLAQPVATVWADTARTIPLSQACGRYVDWYAVAPGTPASALHGVVAPQVQPIVDD